LFGLYLLYVLLVPLLQFAIADAVWTGDDREACVGQHGACWAYVKAYFPQFIYGRYPEPERWRVDIVFVLLAGGLIPMLIPDLPFKRLNTIFLLLIFPVTAFILLTGGNVSIANGIWYFLAALFVLIHGDRSAAIHQRARTVSEVRPGMIGDGDLCLRCLLRRRHGRVLPIGMLLALGRRSKCRSSARSA
jgi:general L-amino acid transport system permease protein